MLNNKKKFPPDHLNVLEHSKAAWAIYDGFKPVDGEESKIHWKSKQKRSKSKQTSWYRDQTRKH